VKGVCKNKQMLWTTSGLRNIWQWKNRQV